MKVQGSPIEAAAAAASRAVSLIDPALRRWPGNGRIQLGAPVKFVGQDLKRPLLAAAAVLSFAAVASAADLPAKGVAYKAPPSVPADNWTGVYVGVNAGFAGGRAPYSLEANAAESYYVTGFSPTPSSVTPNGFIGGAQIGYNFQFGNIVVGLEDDLSYAGMSKTESASGPFFIGGIFNTAVETKLDWFGTTRARLGILAMPNLLLYGTGGLAYGEVGTTTTLSNLGGFGNCDGLRGKIYCGTGSTSGVSTGWTAGAGLEYGFASHWSVKAEYFYLDLGSQSVTFVDQDVAGSSLTATSKFTAQMVRAGLNYHF